MTATAPASDLPRRPPHPRRLLAAAGAVVLLTLATACSGSQDSAGGSDASADSSLAQAPAEAAAESAGGSGTDLLRSGVADRVDVSTSSTGDRALEPVDARALIKKGTVALRADDVAEARFEVGKVLDLRGGEIAEESTQADDAGAAERVRLVLRVPVAEFDAAIEALTRLPGGTEVIDVATSAEDVSTEVIDTDVRVELQRRSIERISVLLDSAGSLRDIVTIERELSRREADLGSLEKRQQFLADQTSFATITVSIEPPRERPDEPVAEDEDGFLAGLSGGWNALRDATTALLTVGGAVLPFAVVLLVLAGVGRVVVRRLPARTPRTSATSPPSA